MVDRRSGGMASAARVRSVLPARGPHGFRELVWWCGVPCLAVPIVLAIVGVPAMWLLRTEYVLLTGVAAVVTWWTCAELAHNSVGGDRVPNDQAVAD